MHLLLQWLAGLYHGLGCEAFAQGSTYSGNFQQGRRHGFGVCEYYNGDYYEGEWQEGVRQGLGMQQCTDNSNYAGQYSRGLRHGFGAYSFPNGDRYLGQCDSDVPHGYGTYLFATGQAYEGQWAYGKKHGWCVYTVEDGQQWAGMLHLRRLVLVQIALVCCMYRLTKACRCVSRLWNTVLSISMMILRATWLSGFCWHRVAVGDITSSTWIVPSVWLLSLSVAITADSNMDATCATLQCECVLFKVPLSTALTCWTCMPSATAATA